MNPDAARAPGPHAGPRWRAMAFLGVPEQTIDQVFEHLGALHALPDRCLVFGSDMRLLGALVKQWRGVVEVVAIRVPRSALHLFDPVTPVVDAEGLTAAAMLWCAATTVCAGSCPDAASWASRCLAMHV